MRPSDFISPARVSPSELTVDVRMAAVGGKAYVDGVVTYLSAAELNERAIHTKELLREIVADRSPQLDVSKYLWRHEVRIDPAARPISFPHLTLDAEYSAPPGAQVAAPAHYARQKDMLRSLLVHEQLHLWVGPPSPLLNPTLVALIDAIKTIRGLATIAIPDSLQNLGSRARAAVDLHLVINWLELQANKRFVGEPRAEALLLSVAAYPDVYRAVVANDDAIGSVFRSAAFNHFLIEPSSEVPA